jgi:hypothetical protein
LSLHTTLDWPELLQHPDAGDHMAQLYQDVDFLVETIVRYAGAGLRVGEATLIVAAPEHRARFAEALAREGLHPSPAVRMLDAEETLALFMVDGMPQWTAFHRAIGGLIAELRLQYPAVRAYGEMVDLLWQRGERHAAIRLEEFWNETARLQPFSLLCAYAIDPLRGDAYGGGIQSICKTHTHLIPAREYSRLDDAVREASKNVLDQPLAQMLLNLAANHRPQTEMPLGQAALLWLKQNMPRAADKVLEQVRAKLA